MSTNTAYFVRGISAVMNLAQVSPLHHEKLKLKLKNLYEENNELFRNEFLNAMEHPLRIKTFSVSVNTSLEFMGMFIADYPELTTVVVNTLVKKIHFDYEGYRVRSCQLLAYVLRNVEDMAVALCEKITTAMLLCIRDRRPNVRAQAICVLDFLQEPVKGNDDPATRVMMKHMRHDPSPLVRRYAVCCLKLWKNTLGIIIERASDEDPRVQCAAFKSLTQLEFRKLKISERLHLFRLGLKSRSTKVQKCFYKDVLPKWFRDYFENYAEFLKALKLNNKEWFEESKATSKLVIQSLLSNFPAENAIKSLNLNSFNILDQNNMSHETFILWSTLIQRCSDTDNFAFAETICPVLVDYVKFFQDYMSRLDPDEMSPNDKIDHQSILAMYFETANCFDYGDELGRTRMIELTVKVLKYENLDLKVYKIIMKLWVVMMTSEEERYELLAKLFASLLNPGVVSLSADEMRHLTLEKARYVNRKFCVEIEKEQAENKNETEEIARLAKEELEIIDQIKDVEERMKPRVIEDTVFNAETVKLNVKDVELNCKFLDILYAFILQPENGGVVKKLIGCDTHVITKLIDDGFAQYSFERLFRTKGAFALFSLESLKRTLPLVHLFTKECPINQFHKKDVILIIKLLTDIFMRWRFDEIVDDNDFDVSFGTPLSPQKRRLLKRKSCDANESLDPNVVTCRSTVDFDTDIPLKTICKESIFLIVSCLNSSEPEVKSTAVDCLCRLFVLKRLQSLTLLKRLVLYFFNPETKDVPAVRQTVACFLQLFAKKIPGGAELLTRILLPLLIEINEAPRSSALAEVDLMNVADVLVMFTSNRNQTFADENHHDSLAFSFLAYLKDAENEDRLSYVLIRVMAHLEITEENNNLRRELRLAGESLVQKLTKKQNKFYMLKFLSKMAGATNDTASEFASVSHLSAANTEQTEQSTRNGLNGTGCHDVLSNTRTTVATSVANDSVSKISKKPTNERTEFATKSKSSTFVQLKVSKIPVKNGSLGTDLLTRVTRSKTRIIDSQPTSQQSNGGEKIIEESEGEEENDEDYDNNIIVEESEGDDDVVNESEDEGDET